MHDTVREFYSKICQR